jgi:2-keto-3-deoxy-L-fuconate dehydrogenase
VANLASGKNSFGVLETEDETLDEMLGRMVRPLHQLTRAVLPQMIERRRGKIIVVARTV